MICPDCNGRGGKAQVWKGFTRTVWSKCFLCKETGRVDDPPPEPPKEEPKEEETINIDAYGWI